MRSFVKAFAAPPQALVTIVLLVTLTQTGLTLQASEAFMRFLPVRAVHSCWDRGTSCTLRWRSFFWFWVVDQEFLVKPN